MIIFQQGTYLEVVKEEQGLVKLVECSDNGIVQLYRIEWLAYGNFNHEVKYSYGEAYQRFYALCSTWNRLSI